MSPDDLKSALAVRFPDLGWQEPASRPCLRVPAERLLEVATVLQGERAFAFTLLADHCGVDWPARDTLELLWQIDSLDHNASLTLSVELPRSAPVVDSLAGIWTNALWLEREVYDFLGVLYRNHPDLRRLFLEDDWTGWPLRKDYEDGFMLTEPGGRR